ncbi:MAG: flavin-containing monooxygenase [Segniliparus sp.]|uniref:flavin-containing monooxygenase n=1 Tax=Segniliparus sp. TaxID=2804064 RepID=UPI003F2BFAE5
MGNRRVCVIGAGPAGLSLARALRLVGVEYDQYERHNDVGGIWDLDNPGTPMYESAHFISSRQTSGFFDFPMPEHFPDYPGNRQILAYTRSFAEAYGLLDRIRLGTEVSDVTRSGDDWHVRLADGSREVYGAVVCATGTTWAPRTPCYPGRFDGEARHSGSYRDLLEFRGKRVLVVGLGNSGADIACDAAQAADAAFVSVRRGYHLIPKHILGLPADLIKEQSPALPVWLERLLTAGLLRALQGDLSKYGMPKPDHKLFESHPLLNSQLLHHLQHGDVAIKPDVAGFDGDRVRFVDGSSERIDLVLYATGYDWTIPYLDEDYFVWRGNRPQLYLNTFSREHRNLFGLGYVEVNSSAYTLFDTISNLVAQYLRDQVEAPRKAAVLDELIARDKPDLSGGIAFLDSARHSSYVDAGAFRRRIAEVALRAGWQNLTPGMFAPLQARSGSPRQRA